MSTFTEINLYDCQEGYLKLCKLWGEGYFHPLAKVGYNYTVEDIIINITSPGSVIPDLKTVGFTQKRWQRFLHDYLEPMRFAGWLDQIQSIKKHQAISYQTPIYAGHTLGNCLNTLVYRHRDRKLLIFSRVSATVPTLLLDLAFIALIAKIIESIVGADVQAQWHITQLQFHTIHSLIMIIQHDLTFQQHELQNDVDKALVLFAEDNFPKFQAFKRLQTKLIQFQNNELASYVPSIPPMFLYSGDESMFTVNELTQKFGITRKQLRFILRPYRRIVNQIIQVTSPESYDLRWPEGHPEVLAVEYSVKNDVKITDGSKLSDFVQSSGIKTTEQLKALYEKFSTYRKQ